MQKFMTSKAANHNIESPLFFASSIYVLGTLLLKLSTSVFISCCTTVQQYDEKTNINQDKVNVSKFITYSGCFAFTKGALISDFYLGE